MLETLGRYLQPAENLHISMNADPLDAIGTLRTFEADTLIFGESDPSTHVFVIRSGEVRLCKYLRDGRRQVTGFLRNGGLVGYIARGTYSYSAEAITRLELYRIPVDELTKAVEACSEIRERVLAICRGELVAAQEQMVMLGRKSARERVVTFLISRSERSCQMGAIGTVELPMRRCDVADFLGLSAETVSREFSALEEQGLIDQTEKCRVLIPDMCRLKLAGDVN